MHEAETRDAPAYLDADEENSLLPSRPKFSWRIMVVLVVHIAVINGTSELIWPFINQLILNAGIAPDESSVGFYSGLIETVASFFSFAAVIPGSVAADRWGRKVLLCSTLLGTAVGLMFFGISNTLFGLVAFRCIGYALGPQLGWSTAVTILGDVSDPRSRGMAFSAVNASYRIGQFFSPTFASTFAHPRGRYSWFQSDFWAQYPYALPCWAGAVMCISTLYVTICYLPETAPDICYFTSGQSSEDGYAAISPYSKDLPPRMIPAITDPAARKTALQSGNGLFTPHVIQLLISSWVMYFMTAGFFALFPLWAFTPISSGGLGASEATIGSYISARAIAQFLGLIPFAYFERRLGIYRLYAYCLTIFTVAGTIGFPLLNSLAKMDGINSSRFNLGIILFFALGGLGNYCTTCMVIMMNQAAPSPQALSRLVGISQSVLMLGQCMAPVIVLSLFEFSIKSNFFGGNFIWAFLIGTSLIASIHSFTLRAPLCKE